MIGSASLNTLPDDALETETTGYSPVVSASNYLNLTMVVWTP
jgi:hypothetical protein